MLLEGLSFLDALYMIVITISTVGFREVKDFSPAGKIFTIFIILSSLGAAAYVFTNIFSFLLEGKFREIWRWRKMENKIAGL